ncbi:MAG: hypothetical protein Q9178_006907 [Gyalolechia marmorata]
MVGSMYYLGVSPALKNAQASGNTLNLGQGMSATKGSNPPPPIDHMMSCNKDRGDRTSPSKSQQSRPRGPALQHVRFGPVLPTRTSQLAAMVKASPVSDSAFAISSPGDVSPFSLDESPTTSGAEDTSLHTPRTGNTDEPVKGSASAMTTIRQLTPQQPKSGRPSLTVRIPRSTTEPPVEVYPSANSGSDCSPTSAKLMPIDTPAHARRLSAQEGSRATKQITLRDELAILSLSGSGERSPLASAKSLVEARIEVTQVATRSSA